MSGVKFPASQALIKTCFRKCTWARFPSEEVLHECLPGNNPDPFLTTAPGLSLAGPAAYQAGLFWFFFLNILRQVSTFVSPNVPSLVRTLTITRHITATRDATPVTNTAIKENRKPGKPHSVLQVKMEIFKPWKDLNPSRLNFGLFFIFRKFSSSFLFTTSR